MILAVDSKEGIIQIGSPPEKLPGILRSISVNGELVIDSASVDGASGKKKTIQGWSDASVSITLSLVDDYEVNADNSIGKKKKSRFECLAEIVKAFKQVEDGTAVLYSFHHPMASAWGIKQLVFSKLSSDESAGRQVITARLDFEEHNPIVGEAQDRQKKSSEQSAQDQQDEAQQVEPSDDAVELSAKLEHNLAKY